MAKNRMYVPSSGRKSKLFVGTIEADQIRKIEQASRRLQRLALETRSGQGAHGPSDKRSKHRADRREGKRIACNWQKAKSHDSHSRRDEPGRDADRYERLPAVHQKNTK